MKADNISISKLLRGDVQLVLPHFQREYTWDESNWETLLADAMDVYQALPDAGQEDSDRPPVEHFLGSIVVILDGSKAMVSA